MSLGLLGALSERANPIVLQEVRRGLRTRVFSVVFVLLLVSCAVIALIAFGVYEPGSSSVGKGTFVAVFGGLSVVGFFMLPYSAYRSLSREMEDKTWPLLLLTGLSPRRILAGKVGSTALQALLYASAIAPFLLFAYLLQGVSLVVVAVVLGASIAWHLFLTVAAVTAATLGETRLVRGAMHFVVLGGLLWGAGAGFGYGTAMVMNNSSSDLETMLIIAGVGSWLVLSYGLVLFAVAVSRLTFEADNHAFWPRLALLLHFLGCAALCFGIELPTRSHLHLGFVLGLLGSIHAFMAGLFSATTRPGLSKRLRSQRPRFTLAGLLLPGAANGLHFAMVLVLLFAVAGIGLTALEGTSSDQEREVLTLVLLAAMALIYLSLPIAVGRGWLRRWMVAPAFLQALGVLILVAAVGIPPLGALIADTKVNDPMLNLFNPILGATNVYDDKGTEAVAVLWVVALGLLFWAQRVSAARDREANGG
ncbi:MAG: ABC transporter permease [Deltaproteobacteria bacterium]|nr:ABC transporter permease [Deltaproteobacteria bacterium]